MTQDRKSRRTKGTGGVYQRASDGMWCVSVELPPGPDGKRRRKVIVRAKRSAALEALRETTKALATAGDLRTSSPTLAQWCDTWWQRYGLTRLKVTTRPSYQSKIEQYIKPAIGRTRIDRLDVDHVHRLHAYVTDTKGLSASSAAGAHRVLSAILADAEKEGRVSRNIAKVASKPRVGKKAKAYLTNAQAGELLTKLASDDPQAAARWGVALLTGKRQGECLGLTRGAVDLEAGSVAISWQLVRLQRSHGCGAQVDGARPCGRKRGGDCPSASIAIPDDQEVRHLSGGLYLQRPKSRASWAVLPMVGYLVDLLRPHVEAASGGPDDLLFTRPDGRPLDPGQDNRAWHALLAKYGLPDVDVHSTRHTCNTVLTELQVPVDVRRAMLGHASAAVNEAVYTHTSDVRVADAMRALGESMR